MVGLSKTPVESSFKGLKLKSKICFIGAGNMTRSLIGGLLANQYEAKILSACDINSSQLESLQASFAINTSTDNLSLAAHADIIILAVKPQVLRKVCEGLSVLPNNPSQLFISIAAGIPSSNIDAWLGGGRALVRCMPNTPSLMQLGATGLFAGSQVSSQQKIRSLEIMRAVGICIEVEQESDLDAVTAISGSGPAYFFYFVECLEAAAVELGLSQNTASQLARQTALGAASMMKHGDPAELRAQVTSKNGTTEAAIQSMQHNQLDQLVNQAAIAACQRALALATELTTTEN